MAAALHDRSSMNKPISLLLLSVTLAACATEGDDLVDIEISASDPSGKADAIDGKRMRLRMPMRINPWLTLPAGDPYADYYREQNDLSKWRTVDIDAATAETVVATGSSFSFDGTDGLDLLQYSKWSRDQLLSLSVEKRATDTHRIGFILQDGAMKTLTCKRGDLRLNYFEQLTINLQDRELYANGAHTFTFAECAIDQDGKQRMALAGPDKGKTKWRFEVFVLPISTTGRLEGSYEYRLTADVL
jgi:hypothetical protein